MSPTIDIIIPTLNRPLRVRSLVETLKDMLMPKDTITVVWQGGDKPDIQAHTSISVLSSNPPNLPTARNLGIRNTCGQIILFLDDDVEVCGNFLSFHRNAYEDKNIGAIAGSIEDPLFPQWSSGHPRFNVKTGELIQSYCSPIKAPVVAQMGAHMSFRRAALKQIGGFDTNYKGNALWEDVDCAFRLRAFGHTILYEPRAMVKHLRDDFGGCRSSKRYTYIFQEFYNTFYFASRFAPGAYRTSWIKYWWYRLEYYSRKPFLRLKHNPFIVAAGILGAISGIATFGVLGNRIERPSDFVSFRSWMKHGVNS